MRHVPKPMAARPPAMHDGRWQVDLESHREYMLRIARSRLRNPRLAEELVYDVFACEALAISAGALNVRLHRARERVGRAVAKRPLAVRSASVHPPESA